MEIKVYANLFGQNTNMDFNVDTALTRILDGQYVSEEQHLIGLKDLGFNAVIRGKQSMAKGTYVQMYNTNTLEDITLRGAVAPPKYDFDVVYKMINSPELDTAEISFQELFDARVAQIEEIMTGQGFKNETGLKKIYTL